ncbi:MAG TPA: hypothetical protein VNC84_00450 [Gammaproteobacteria bacterium]|jgi:hypothetical protein|nr:hypothetical protein [Gammaproteobacteria bacterium]
MHKSSVSVNEEFSNTAENMENFDREYEGDVVDHTWEEESSLLLELRESHDSIQSFFKTGGDIDEMW